MCSGLDLLVPSALRAGNSLRILSFDLDTSYEYALSEIWKAIGCDNETIKFKPELSFKIGKSKSPSLVLCSDLDWKILRTNAQEEAQRKKVEIQVEIIVGPENVSSIFYC
jgi:hypothetical protein